MASLKGRGLKGLRPPDREEPDPDDIGLVQPDQVSSQSEDQLLGELIGPDKLLEIEEQAKAWEGEEDGGLETVAKWASQRAFVHLQVQDYIATGSDGAAKIANVIKAGKEFSTGVVKILKAMQRPEAEGVRDRRPPTGVSVGGKRKVVVKRRVRVK